MNGSLKYKFTDWLDAEIKAGSDMYFTEGEENCMQEVLLIIRTAVIALARKTLLRKLIYSFLDQWP